jgi:hypothetical protein
MYVYVQYKWWSVVSFKYRVVSHSMYRVYCTFYRTFSVIIIYCAYIAHAEMQGNYWGVSFVQ